MTPEEILGLLNHEYIMNYWPYTEIQIEGIDIADKDRYYATPADKKSNILILFPPMSMIVNKTPYNEKF